MQTKKILILLGHPTRDSLCGALADSYAKGVEAGGGDAEVVHAASLKIDFLADPRSVRELEPDVLELQHKITDASGVVWVYPMWWGTAPAALKGLVDRVMIAGFAFKYKENSPLPEKLLTGKFARIFVTMDSPVIWHWLVYKFSATQWLKWATLWFSGFKVRGVHQFPMVRASSASKREQWLRQAFEAGKKDGSRASA